MGVQLSFVSVEFLSMVHLFEFTLDVVERGFVRVRPCVGRKTALNAGETQFLREEIFLVQEQDHAGLPKESIVADGLEQLQAFQQAILQSQQAEKDSKCSPPPTTLSSSARTRS